MTSYRRVTWSDLPTRETFVNRLPERDSQNLGKDTYDTGTQ